MSSKIIDKYFNLRKQIYDYFGYQEDWRVLPLMDTRQYFWYKNDDEILMTTKGDFNDEDDLYSQEIYHGIYHEKDDLVIIGVDTCTDFNVFLIVLDKTKQKFNLEVDD